MVILETELASENIGSSGYSIRNSRLFSNSKGRLSTERTNVMSLMFVGGSFGVQCLSFVVV